MSKYRSLFIAFVLSSLIFCTISSSVSSDNTAQPEWMKLSDYKEQFGEIPFVKSTEEGTIFCVRTAKYLYSFKYDGETWYVKLEKTN